METKDRILEITWELFQRHGIKRVTMDDVARQAGISKKTIYVHYADKDDLVNAITAATLRKEEIQFEDLKKQSVNAVEEIIKAMKHMGTFFSELNPNLFYDMQRFHPQAWALFHEFKEGWITNMIEDNLIRGIKEGFYRSNINLRILSRLRIEQAELAMNPAAFSPDKFNISEVQVQLLDHYLHGISTLKGHKLINKYLNVVEED